MKANLVTRLKVFNVRNILRLADLTIENTFKRDTLEIKLPKNDFRKINNMLKSYC